MRVEPITPRDIQEGFRESGTWQDYMCLIPSENTLALCGEDNHVVVCELDGQRFAFLYSMSKTDEDILAAIRTLQWAGFVGVRKALGVTPDEVFEWFDETITVLLDAPLQPVGIITDCATEEEVCINTR